MIVLQRPARDEEVDGVLDEMSVARVYERVGEKSPCFPPPGRNVDVHGAAGEGPVPPDAVFVRVVDLSAVEK